MYSTLPPSRPHTQHNSSKSHLFPLSQPFPFSFSCFLAPLSLDLWKTGINSSRNFLLLLYNRRNVDADIRMFSSPPYNNSDMSSGTSTVALSRSPCRSTPQHAVRVVVVVVADSLSLSVSTFYCGLCLCSERHTHPCGPDLAIPVLPRSS